MKGNVPGRVVVGETVDERKREREVCGSVSCVGMSVMWNTSPESESVSWRGGWSG